jgi:hypothetical protein
MAHSPQLSHVSPAKPPTHPTPINNLTKQKAQHKIAYKTNNDVCEHAIKPTYKIKSDCRRKPFSTTTPQLSPTPRPPG